MIHHLRRLSAQTLVFGLGDAVTRVAALLLLPVYTRILTPQDYGTLAVVTLVTTVVGIIANSGQNSAFFRFYFQADTSDARRRLTGTVLIYLLCSAVLVIGTFMLLLGRIASWLFMDTTLLPLTRIALVGTLFDIGLVVPFATFRARQQAGRYAILSLVRFLINIVLNIIAVAILRLGVVGVVCANLLTSFSFSLVCMALTLRTIEWTVDRILLEKLLRFGLPIVPANLAGWALTLSARFFLQRYSDLAQVGVFALASSIGGIVHMFSSWLNTAYAPYCFSISKDEGAKAVYARVLYVVIALLTFFGLGLSLFARPILILLTRPDYYGAANIVPLIVLAYLLSEMNYLVSFGLDLTGKTGYYPLIIGAGAVASLLLNLALIPRFGMMGAAVASVCSNGLILAIEYFVVRRLYPVPYEWKQLLKLALASVGVCLVGVGFGTGDLWVDLALGGVLLCTWLAVLFWWGFYSRDEVSALRRITTDLLRGFIGRLHRDLSVRARGVPW